MVFIVSCGGEYGTPLPEDLAGYEVSRHFAAKQTPAKKALKKQWKKWKKQLKALRKLKKKSKKDKQKWKDLKKKFKAWRLKNMCTTPSDDPLANQMPDFRLRQTFEKEKLGALAPVHRWIDAADTTMTVTNEAARSGSKSLKIVTSPGAKRTTGVKFCVRCEAMERFKARFSIRFDSFISWNGLMVTNNPDLAYWWWVRSNGTVFDDPQSTAATLQPGVWHDVKIKINRNKDLAKLTVDGATYSVPLTGTWYDGAADQPMGCFRVMTLAPAQTAQTLYIDNIKVHAIM